MALDLSKIGPRPGARKVGKRLGRGEASGLGKTSGRGGKGQTARSGGKIKAYFEGGQMPLYRRVPKVGFVSRRRVLGLNKYQTISLAQLEQFDNGASVTPELLLSSGIRTKASQKAGYKLLASGTLTKKLTISVHAVTEAAKAKIEALGGTVNVLGSLTDGSAKSKATAE